MRPDTKYYHYFFAALWLLTAFAIPLFAAGPEKILAYVSAYAAIGLFAVVFAVCLTPLSRVVRHPFVASLLLNRRYIGLWGYAFVLTHVLLVVEHLLDRNLGFIFQPDKIPLLLGFLAFTILTAMAFTSSDQMVRRLGGQNWKRLHSLVYVAILLVAIHAFNLGKVVFAADWAKWALVGLVVLVALFKAKHQFKLF